MEGEIVVRISDKCRKELIEMLSEAAHWTRVAILSNPVAYEPDWKVRPRDLIHYIRVIDSLGYPHKEGTLFGFSHMRIASLSESYEIEGTFAVNEKKRLVKQYVEDHPEERRELLGKLFI